MAYLLSTNVPLPPAYATTTGELLQMMSFSMALTAQDHLLNFTNKVDGRAMIISSPFMLLDATSKPEKRWLDANSLRRGDVQ